MNSKITLKSVLNLTLAVGAMALTLADANAQSLSTPFGVLGYTNLYGISVYGGLGGFGSFGGYDTGFGSPLGGLFGTPLSGGVSFLGGPYSGGYAILGSNGATIVDPYYQNNQGSFIPNARSANKTNDPANSNHAVGGSVDNSVPLPLSQSLVVRRGRNFDLSIGWHGDPDLITNLKVTLLNRYHLPVAEQVTEGTTPAHFAANRNTFAARYYRVEVQYADGATAAITNPLRFATR